MTTSNAPSQTIHWSIHEYLREYLTSARLAEIIYRDSAGQVCLVHDVIRDLFSRAGQDFILLSRGRLVGIDHVLTIDGRSLSDRKD